MGKRWRVVVGVAVVVGGTSGCTSEGSGAAWDPEWETDAASSGEPPGTQPSGGATTSDASGQTDAADSSGEPAVCPEPTVPPELVEDSEEFACPEGMTFDAAYFLCVNDQVARGPFTDPIVQDCLACGAAECEDEDWPLELARGLRGTDRCPAGSTMTDGLCVDPTYAWGPFSPPLVAACEAAGGGMACSSMRWDRGFAEGLEPIDPAAAPWTWILPLDYAIREDGLGGGHFGAPRSGNPGGHSGIDILAPVGTDLIAPCDGPVWAGWASGYGNYVQLACPVPEVVAEGQSLYASVFFAHLDTLAVDNGASVTAGQAVGTVGKSGNANSPGINAHVHFEIAIHGSEGDALGETHASSNHAGNAASDAFAAQIASICWDPNGLTPLSGPSMKGRRPDPFMMLACLTADKPTMSTPPALLQGYLVPWSDHYDASGFDVDEG